MNETARPHREQKNLPQELKERLRQLNSSSPAGATVTATVDARIALENLGSALDAVHVPITPSVAKKICKSLLHSALRRPRKQGFTIKYSEETVRGALSVLTRLVKITFASAADPSTPSKKSPFESLKPLLALALETLVALCQMADDATCWKYCMDFVSLAAGLTKTSSPELLSDSDKTYPAIKQGLISDLKLELRKGRTGEALSIFGSVRGVPSLRQALTDSLAAMLERDSGKLPVSSQEWM